MKARYRLTLDEALPPDAVKTGEKFGNAEVYETARWRYLISADGKVLNVVALASPDPDARMMYDPEQ